MTDCLTAAATLRLAMFCMARTPVTIDAGHFASRVVNRGGTLACPK